MTHAAAKVYELDPGAGDPILGCLTALARRYHRLVDEGILSAGMAFDKKGRLSFDAIPHLAMRAGFAAESKTIPLEELTDGHLPAMLLLADAEVCILTARYNGSCQILLSRISAPTVVPTSTLASRYSGRAILLRPREWTADGDRHPLPKAALPWRAYLPLALAAIPADLIALAVAVVLPPLSRHWGTGPRTVAAAAALAVLLESLLRLVRGHLLDHAGRPAEGTLARHLFRQLLGQPRPGSAGAFAAALQAFETERANLLRAVVAAVAELPLFILLLAGLAYLGGPLVVPQLIALPAFLALGLSLEPATARAARRCTRDDARRHGLLVEALARTDHIRALAIESRLERHWTERSMAAAKSAARARLTELFVRGLASALQGMVLVGIGVWGARLVESQEMRAATLAVCLLLSGRLVAHMAEATHLLAHHRKALATVESLRDLPQPKLDRHRAEPHLLRPRLRDAIVFDDVTFRYDDRSDAVLHHLNLRIDAGQRIALTGAPGAGKTTLARLMLGLHPPSTGQISVDGLAAAADAARIRPLFAYAPQEPALFAGSLRDNLTLGLPRADDDGIRWAAELAGIEGLVDRLGLNGMVGEHGVFLSTGERQGVSLARALLADASVLLLDEPCTAWCDEALARLASRLRQTLTERTLILITHRRPLLALADRTVRLEGGRLAEMG